MTKFYAVKVGRQGPKIYTSWPECERAVSRYPGAIHSSFPSRQQAEAWIAPNVAAMHQFKTTHNEDQSTGSRTGASSLTNSEQLRSPPTATPHPTPARIQSGPLLSLEQRSLLNSVLEGRSVFFTGSAGVGKSVVLRAIIAALGGPSDRVAVTASTGIASVNIGGTTLHSWAGIGLGQETKDKLADKLQFQRTLRTKKDGWIRVRTLIIDEISMLDGVLFDKLEYVARRLRQNEAPFGGIQLVLSGDFCQLPPVPERSDGVTRPVTFAFDADSWESCVGQPVTLTRVFRQKEPAFIKMLNAMRFGQMEPSMINSFAALSRQVEYQDGIEPTELFPTRKEVEDANNSRLARLADPIFQYRASDTGASTGLAPAQITKLLDRLVAPANLTLKVGAQVMLIKNLVQGSLVNGSVGQVTDFVSANEAAQAGAEIVGGDSGSPQNDLEKMKELAAEKRESAKNQGNKWPLVRFTNGKTFLCTPVEFSVNNSRGEPEAKRFQVPLILAWALSVHKSQGQTLERVKVDLRRTFEKGQAYVALSRATGLGTLQVLNFHPHKVQVHPRVVEWHRDMTNREQEEVDRRLDEEENTRDFEEPYS